MVNQVRRIVYIVHGIQYVVYKHKDLTKHDAWYPP